MGKKKKTINREVQILLLGLLPELYCYARKQNSNENFTNTALSSFDDLTDMPEQADYRTVEHTNVNGKKVKEEIAWNKGLHSFPLHINTLRTGDTDFFFNTVKLGTSAVLLGATPQGGMFPEVSHPQALLGSLVSIS